MIHEFRVRPYQTSFHKALVNRDFNRFIAIWHRRAGKDEIILDAMRTLALKEPGTYWHTFPEQAQARKALWNGVDGNTGKRRILQAFPEQIIKRMVDNDMFIELKNGATYQLIGSDRYDATVGSGPRGIAYSEWALSNPAAWAYHSPMLRENNGWAAFITTPRGDNHAKTMFDRAQTNPKWFSELLSIEDTKQLSQEILTEALQEYIDLHGAEMGQALYEQEYLCSWNSALIGAIFGIEMNRAEREGRIRPVEIDKEHPVHTAWDLGKASNNPIWCFQVIGGQPRVVDFYTPESEDLEEWIAWLNMKGYTGFDYVPHDIMATEWGTGRTRIDRLRELRGSNRVKRIPKVAVKDGWQAGYSTINEAVFHRADDERGERMKIGINGLKSYRKIWNEDRQTFDMAAYKDWAEHIGSAFRYLALSWRELKIPEPKKVKPKELAYQVKDGQVVANMSVKELVEMKMRKRRLNG